MIRNRILKLRDGKANGNIRFAFLKPLCKKCFYSLGKIIKLSDVNIQKLGGRKTNVDMIRFEVLK